jgi:hypothetical protein
MADYKSQLMNLPDAQLDSLASSGYIPPGTVAEIKAMRGATNFQDVSIAPEPMAPAPVAPTGSYSQDQIGQQMAAANAPNLRSTRDTNLAMAQNSPEAFNAMQATLSGIGAQPAEMPAPLAPGMAAQSPQELDAEVQALAQTEATVQNAQAKAQREVANQQAVEAQKSAELEAKRDAATEAKVSKDMESSGMGSQIAQAIAIMMGAYSQGLTGAKENPAVQAIEKELDRQAEKRKWNAEQQAKATELALKMFNAQLDAKKANEESAFKKTQMEKMGLEGAKLLNEIQVAQGSRKLQSQQFFSKADQKSLVGEDGDKIRQRLVSLPYSKSGLALAAPSAEAAGKIREFMSQTGGALANIDDVMRIAQSSDFNKLNPWQRAELNTKIAMLAGALRLPITGPGPMTDDERKFLLNTIGNPNKIFSLKSIELENLSATANTIKSRVKEHYKHYGLTELPESENEIINRDLEARGYDPARIERARQNAKKLQGR